MTATNPVTRDFSCIDDPAVFIEDSFDAATILQMEGLSPSAVVMLSPQRMSANADASNDENDDPSCGGYHCHATKRRLSIGDANTPIQKRPLGGSSRLSTSQKRHPIVTPLVSTPEQIPAGHKREIVSCGRRSNGVLLQGSASGGRVFGTNLLVNQHHTTHRSPAKVDAKLFDTTPTKEGDCDESHEPSEEDVLEATVGPEAHSLISHFCKESLNEADVATSEFKGISEEELLDHYVPLEEYEKVLKERNRYREMYRYQSSMCDDYYQREREAQEKLQDKVRELIAVSSRNEESKRFIRQMKREMLDCRERTLPFLNKKIEDDRKEKEIKDKFARQLMIEEENFERLEQQMKEELAAMEAMLKDLRKACSLGKSSESLLKASYQKNTHLYGELCQSRRQLDSELDRRVHLEKLNEILRKEKREAELGTSRERRRHFSREDTLIREAHELQDEIVRLRQKLLDRAVAAGVNLIEEEETEEEEEEFEVIADDEQGHGGGDTSFVIDQEEEEENPPRRSTRLSPPTARKALFPLEDITSEHTRRV